MPIFDDDEDTSSDDRQPRRGGGDSWDVVDDAPDNRDLVPDEYTTVRCTRCRKLIFEDSVSCPYCKQIQLADEQNKKPIWWLLTVVFCVAAIGGIVMWLLMKS